MNDILEGLQRARRDFRIRIWLALLGGIVSVALATAIAFKQLPRTVTEDEAVQHGAAHYVEVDGTKTFVWNDERDR